MFQWFSSGNMEYNKYKDILEYIPNNNNKIKNIKYEECDIVKCMEIFANNERQGKYIEMSDKIFANYRNLKSNEDLPRQYAQELGLDMVKFDQDMKDPALEARINKEMNQLQQSGIPRKAVPKFLINGKEPQGGRNLASYSAIIDAELKKN